MNEDATKIAKLLSDAERDIKGVIKTVEASQKSPEAASPPSVAERSLALNSNFSLNFSRSRASSYIDFL